jgi:hypothetical protein
MRTIPTILAAAAIAVAPAVIFTAPAARAGPACDGSPYDTSDPVCSDCIQRYSVAHQGVYPCFQSADACSIFSLPGYDALHQSCENIIYGHQQPQTPGCPNGLAPAYVDSPSGNGVDQVGCTQPNGPGTRNPNQLCVINGVNQGICRTN